MLGIIKVTGRSMMPVLNDGDYVMTRKPRTPRAGFIYVLKHHEHGKIIKRIDRLDHETVWYKSDNPNGSCGDISVDKVTARAWLAITPKGMKRL
ncbi:MAG: S24/S26 family peptidase [Litorimonas sp.]